MKIKFLGTAGFMPTEKRHTSCVILPEEGIILDAGTGFFRVRENLPTKHADILLSHYHPDHICGLTYMLGAFYISKPKVTIYGPEGIENLEEKLIFPIKFKDHPFKIKLKKVKEKFKLGNVRIKTKLFPHLDQVSVGYRLEKKVGEEKESLCYLTDMIPSDEGAEFAKNVDILIHECYFYKDSEELAKQTFHGYTTQVAELAKKAKAKYLVLYHVNPLVEHKISCRYVKECKEIFNNTLMAYDNLVLPEK